ncbi:MAG: hypothetical protein ACI35Q_03700 [Marinilabiliaceae bacterium]
MERRNKLTPTGRGHYVPLIIAVVSTLIMNGCAPNKQLIAKQTIDEANKLYAAGQYAEAYNKYSSASAQSTEWDSETCRMATISASAIHEDSAACAWGARFSSFGDVEKLKAVSTSLERLGDMESRSRLILSDTTSFFSILGEQPVLCIIAKEQAKNQDKALVATYGRLTDGSVKADLFDSYFKFARTSVSDKQLERDCADVLKTSPDKQNALYFLGKRKYDSAESTYAKLMSDYNKKKTQAAYAYLTRDLKKVVTPLYKESKSYFERLRKIDADNETYIKYLININDRLSNQTEVKRLKRLLK